MIAEPYICIRGNKKGDIYTLLKDEYEELWRPYQDVTTVRLSYCKNVDMGCDWQPYTDFEREKLRELGWRYIGVGEHGFCRYGYTSGELIGYISDDWESDSESNRLLKRAEFLKAVCEKEGVQFLPTQADSDCMKKCRIDGCENEGANGRGNHCWKHYHRIRTHGDPETVGHNWKIESLNDHAGIKRMIEEKVSVNLATGCWEWTGTRSKQGYGKQTIKRSKQQTLPAHRLSAMVYLGFDIESEELVCHKCDNPPCCNPEHLFIGDWESNAEDMVAKGRAVDVSDRQRTGKGTFLPKAS